jgi:hypothetical protein
MTTEAGTAEQRRLAEAREKTVPWRKWGPYLSERQWGTVREDYSDTGDAWNYFTHDQARSRAYHWGEDGLAGFSDDKQRLWFALALWNGKDPHSEGAALRSDQWRRLRGVRTLGAWVPGPVEAGSVMAQATGSGEAKPSKIEARTVTVRGTVEAVDKCRREGGRPGGADLHAALAIALDKAPAK